MKQTFVRAPRGNRPPEPVIPGSMPTVDSGILSALLGLPISPVYVNDESAGGLPAIGRGVDMICDAVATMLSSADVVSGSGDVLPTPANILTRPNVLYGSYEFWQMVVRSTTMRGNFVGILTDFDTFGYARQVVPVAVDLVSLDVSSGYPIYTIFEDRYGPDEIVHIRSHAHIGGLWGRGIIERYRTELQGQLYQQQYGKNSWQNGAVPSAVIQLDTPVVKQETADAIQQQWIDRHGSGQRKPAVISKAMSITPLSWSPEDAQFVESSKLSVAACAHICGLRPEDLGASVGGSALTYGNRTDDALQRILDSYSPWLHLIEQAWSDLLPGSNYCRGNVEALLRTSTKQRFEVYQLGLGIGVYDENDIRKLEHLPPRPVSMETVPPPPALKPVAPRPLRVAPGA